MQALDEATLNEYPSRDVGVFVSIGTGKRPGGTDAQQHQWWESFVGGTAGEFAEARRRLMAKIEGCEETHQYMVREHLSKRGVNVENYYRLNVEVGVGEFGMNEWNRLSDISTSSRMYLGRPEIQQMTQSASVKLAKINTAKIRWNRGLQTGEQQSSGHNSWQESVFETTEPVAPPSNPLAVELPADEGFSETRSNSQVHSSPRSPPVQQGVPFQPPYPHQRVPTGGADKIVVPTEAPARISDEFPTAVDHDPQRRPAPTSHPNGYNRPPPSSYDAYGHPPAYDPTPVSAISPNTAAMIPTGPVSAVTPGAPPLPPKSPIRDYPVPGLDYPGMRPLPYPDDAPPPPVNMAKKPQSGVR